MRPRLAPPRSRAQSVTVLHARPGARLACVARHGFRAALTTLSVPCFALRSVSRRCVPPPWRTREKWRASTAPCAPSSPRRGTQLPRRQSSCLARRQLWRPLTTPSTKCVPSRRVRRACCTRARREPLAGRSFTPVWLFPADCFPPRQECIAWCQTNGRYVDTEFPPEKCGSPAGGCGAKLRRFALRAWRCGNADALRASLRMSGRAYATTGVPRSRAPSTPTA